MSRLGDTGCARLACSPCFQSRSILPARSWRCPSTSLMAGHVVMVKAVVMPSYDIRSMVGHLRRKLSVQRGNQRLILRAIGQLGAVDLAVRDGDVAWRCGLERRQPRHVGGMDVLSRPEKSPRRNWPRNA